MISGTVNVGNTTANNIGSTTYPISFSATTATGGTIYGINMGSTSPTTINIQNNTILGMSTSGIASSAFDFYGINLTGSAAFNVTNNTIGNTSVTNSLTFGALGTTTGPTNFRGIIANTSGDVTIGAFSASNIIQNITMMNQKILVK